MSALVGREQPAAVLEAEVDRALTSHGGLVLVAGEAGIGKSTLVAGAVGAARAGDALVAVGACWDREGAPGHWPWVQVVRALARAAPPDAWEEARAEAGGELDALLGGAGTTLGAGGADEFALHDAVTLLLVALARTQPVVVVLEDLHWADEASLRLLEFAARHGWYERILLVGTYRDVEVDAGDHPLAAAMAPLVARATTVTLTGLDRDAVAALVAATTGQAPPDAVVDDLHRRTGGNPFFVEQTARLWQSRGAVADVPPGVRDAVERRLALVPDAGREALVTAALLGHDVRRPVLAAALGLAPDAVDAALAEPLAARLVVAGDDGTTVRFVHDLVRETLVAGLDPADARRRHAAILDALEAPALADHVSVGDRAHHAHQAGDEVDLDRRVALLQAAARDAAGRMAMEEAIGHLRRALDGIPAEATRQRAFADVELGWMLLRAAEDGSPELFESATRTALALDDDALLTRAALSVRATVWMANEEEAEARAAELVDEAHRRLVVEGGHPSTAATPWEREQELTALAVDLCRSSGDDRALWDALTVRHDAVWAVGRAADRLAVVDELLEVARRRGALADQLEAHQLRLVDLVELGDPRAHAEHATFRSLAGRLDSARVRVFTLWMDALIASLEGRFDDARARLEQVDALEGKATGDTDDRGALAVQVRWAIELQQGRDDAVDALLEEAVAHPHAELLHAVTAIERGEVERAAAMVASVRGTPEEPGRWFEPLWLRLQAQVAGATADRDLATALAADLRPRLADLSGQWALMAQGPLDGPYDLWAGMVEKGQGDLVAARARLAAAVEGADRLGARAWAARARTELALLDGDGDAVAAAVEEARPLGLAPLVARLEARSGAAAPAPAPATAAAGASPGAPVAEAPTSGPSSPGPDAAVFRRDGDVWELTFAGTTVHVPDAKGVRDIHALLGRPGMGVRAVDLLDPEAGAAGRAARSMGGDDVLDERAKAAYRTRLTHLDEEIDSALARGDDGRAARLDEERAALIEELRRATGLGGRSRRLGDDAERARKAVRERIRDTIRRLDRTHPALAAHLRDSVKTGATCSYEPPDPVTWSR